MAAVHVPRICKLLWNETLQLQKQSFLPSPVDVWHTYSTINVSQMARHRAMGNKNRSGNAQGQTHDNMIFASRHVLDHHALSRR